MSQQPPPAAEPKPPRQKHKCDPEHVALARELRDRYLEEINRDPSLLPARTAKYDVVRILPAHPAPDLALKSLPAAA